MGYTNYWNDNSPGLFDEEFLDEVRRTIKLSGEKIVYYVDDSDKETSECVPVITTTQIAFNGAKDNGYEDFYMSATYSGSAFCKTARRGYDKVVKVVLILAAKRGYVTDVRWDGIENYKDPASVEAYELLRKVLCIGEFANTN